MHYVQPTTGTVILFSAIVGANLFLPPAPGNPARVALQVAAHYATVHVVVWTVEAVYRAL